MPVLSLTRSPPLPSRMTIAQSMQEAERAGQEFLTTVVGPALLDILKGGEEEMAALDKLAELGIPRLGCVKLSPEDLIATPRFFAPCKMARGSYVILAGDEAGENPGPHTVATQSWGLWFTVLSLIQN